MKKKGRPFWQTKLLYMIDWPFSLLFGGFGSLIIHVHGSYFDHLGDLSSNTILLRGKRDSLAYVVIMHACEVHILCIFMYQV
ncbi:unnamed protein product [Linum tenue]|uniref:Uncharacterized protein n=1 Tax=Linum tenue TaxID=586396 RepID=A0AAV0KTD0_9ROSI|nr:unnamed protein product [Linum tenue]